MFPVPCGYIYEKPEVCNVSYFNTYLEMELGGYDQFIQDQL